MQPQDALPIITTKLHIPPTQPNLVARPRLTAQLHAGKTRRLTLISAPAGFGKTTLVSASLTQQPSAGRVAWLSLDESDNDPARFLTYLVNSVQQIEPDFGQAALQMLRGGQLSQIESLMTLVLNDMAAVTTKFSLVLDDYHVIHHEVVHKALTFLLEHLSPLAHLIIISRIDPPLPLARFRARGHLLELRTDDLRFTVEEASDFLNSAMGLGLQATDIALLEDRTEGWIAGLQLAGLSMQGANDPSAFIATFSGKDRHIVDYLLEEVFQQQSPENQAFLLQTSILDHLCGPLCDAVYDAGTSQSVLGVTVTPTATGQATLEAFERSNLFILPLDNERRWYRYQHLFLEFLRERLQQLEPDLIPELHKRAAQWCLAQGSVDMAINHTLAAQDFEAAAALIEQNTDSVLRQRGELTTYLHWLEKLPTDVLQSRPRLCLDRAWALSFSGDWPQLEVQLQEIEQMLEADETLPADQLAHVKVLRAEVTAMKAEFALYQDSPNAAMALAAQALADLPPKNIRWRATLNQIQGYVHRLNGAVEPAIASFVGIQCLERTGRVFGVWCVCPE